MSPLKVASEIAEQFGNGYTLPEQSINKKEYLIYWPRYVESYYGWKDCDEDHPPVGSIYMNKDGKYIYLYKKEEPNRYFRYDLAQNIFERVNIYKTTENKITQVKVENVRQWFSKHKIFTDNPLFARIFIFNKSNQRHVKYKNPIRYIEAFRDFDAKAIEQWYNADVIIDDVEQKFNTVINNEHAKCGTHFMRVRYLPQDFDKQILKIIKRIKHMSLESLNQFYDFDEPILLKYERLYQMTQKPEYEDAFVFTPRYSSETNIFDFTNRYANIARERIIEVMEEFNLDPEALCRFLNRLRRVEGCTVEDLTDGYHYRDYLRMEKTLNNQNISKIDKYPKNWLTTFRRTKRNYDDIKKRIDEEKFALEVEKHENLVYNDKKYSIILPTESSDIRREGAVLKHCVASYVDSIAKGNTFIVFCRDNIEKDEPYVTIEVKNGRITQAYGYQDSKPEKKALKFIAKWAKNKNLELAWRWEKEFRNRGR